MNIKKVSLGGRKHWAVAMMVLTALAMGAPQSNAEQDDGWNIALSLNLAGKNGWTTCEPFSRDLYDRISRAGGEAYIISFDWEDGNHLRGRHNMVVYRDANDRYWGMDQRQSKPVWLNGHCPEEWVRSFCPGVAISVYKTYTNPANFGQHADLSRAPQRVAYVAYGPMGQRLAMR